MSSFNFKTQMTFKKFLLWHVNLFALQDAGSALAGRLFTTEPPGSPQMAF